MTTLLVYLVRIVYWLAAALGTVAAIAITASMLIAERAPQTAWFWGVTLTVGMFFAGMSLLSLGVAHYLPIIGLDTLGHLDERRAGSVGRGWSRLSIILIIAGSMLCLMLLVCVYAIFERINQGSAVFG
jgi:peptidoglycan/LPS O-acetylase OafA/YrhL